MAPCRVSFRGVMGYGLLGNATNRYTPSSFEIEFYNWQYSGIVTQCQYR